MKLHRFYTGSGVKLGQDVWLHEQRLVHQLGRVLRCKPGDQIVLFNEHSEKLYEVHQVSSNEVHVIHKTDLDAKRPGRDIYLLWALLKKDKNDWVLQKATELGVSHFVPLLADRSEKTGFNVERAHKIVIEAAEQCGRGDIPTVREPMHVATAIDQYQDKITLLICQQAEQDQATFAPPQKAGLLIGPEGGWSEAEKELFNSEKLAHLNLHDFTLRAETAAVVAITKLLQ